MFNSSLVQFHLKKIDKEKWICFKINFFLLSIDPISEPSFRGVMIAYTHIGWTLGMLFVSIMNTIMPWRMVGLACMSVPILTAIALCFVSCSICFLKRKTQSIMENALFLGPRNPVVASLKRSKRRGRKITALAPRMGSKTSGSRRISSPSTLQSTL